jgi:nucleotide-binding universal stress UspA family protein
MSYRSILVNLDIDGPVTPLIKLAADLARRFDARLIGCSGADIVPPFITTEGMMLDGELIERQRTDIEARLIQLQQKFTDAAGTGVDVEWHGDLMEPSRLVIGLARMADLIVSGSPEGAKVGNLHRSMDLGNLLLHAGRPVLLAAASAEHLLAKNVLVAWKDSREARRAVVDAIPLLSGASEVVVATVDRDATRQAKQSVADVTVFLGRHGIRARAEVVSEKGDAAVLKALAGSMHADLIVAGAYGHSRLRELVFGGVTRSLLDEIGVNRLMSC